MKNSIKDLNTKILNIANLIDSKSYNDAIELMYSLEKEEICNCFHSAISSYTKDTLIIVADKIISDKTNETATYEIARLYNNFRYTSLLWIYIILNKHETIINLCKSDSAFKTYIEHLKKTYNYKEFNYYLIIEIRLTGIYFDDFYIKENNQYKSDRSKYLESRFLDMEKRMHWHMSYSFPDEKPNEYDIHQYKIHQDIYNHHNEEQNYKLLIISENKCPCILLELASYHNTIFKDKNPYVYMISESLRSCTSNFEIIKFYIEKFSGNFYFTKGLELYFSIYISDIKSYFKDPLDLDDHHLSIIDEYLLFIVNHTSKSFLKTLDLSIKKDLSYSLLRSNKTYYDLENSYTQDKIEEFRTIALHDIYKLNSFSTNEEDIELIINKYIKTSKITYENYIYIDNYPMTLKEFISKYSLDKTLTFFTSNDLYYLDLSIIFDIKHEYHIVDEDIYYKCLAICSAKSSLQSMARSICYRHINEYYSYIPQNSASCEKYNGYNGWSDDQIDDIFGGIPEATWNVD